MFKFSEKKNREDVIALRWPMVCLSCGTDVDENSESRYAIVGKFYEIKKTQVLIKLPGFFYVCNDCTEKIKSNLQDDKLSKYAEQLLDAPWNQFIEVEKDGCIKIPEGRFKEKLVELNPDICISKRSNPMDALMQFREK